MVLCDILIVIAMAPYENENTNNQQSSGNKAEALRSRSSYGYVPNPSVDIIRNNPRNTAKLLSYQPTTNNYITYGIAPIKSPKSK